ncbi:Proteasome subunit beta type-6 [Platanthera guangdongensis]|uniref:Proteasome subunit beta type-6 n=1 Tax=Platanthera guangdongensis TaxID=2320717 RepID=A0ABR2MBC8_9ASPA
MDPDLSEPHSMGTTIIGVTYDDGVILSADSRTSTWMKKEKRASKVGGGGARDLSPSRDPPHAARSVGSSSPDTAVKTRVKGNEVSSWAGEALHFHICMEAPLHQRVGEGSSRTG